MPSGGEIGTARAAAITAATLAGLSLAVAATSTARSTSLPTEGGDQFRLLAEHVPGVIYLCRNDGRYRMQYLSDAVETLTGYPKQEFLADRISFADLYHPEDRSAVVLEVDRALAVRRPFHVEYRLRHRSGEWRWIGEFGGALPGDGRPELLEGVLFDITARKQAELALRAREETLDAIIHHTPNVAIQAYRDDGTVILWNQAAELMYGWSRDEAAGRTLDQLMLDRDSAAEFLETLRRVDRTNQPVEAAEWEFRRKDGRIGIAWSTIFPIPGADGSRQFICMDIDLTAHREAERQARAAQHELLEQQRRAKERVESELAQARQELVRQTELATIGKMSAQIAHDVRNPVGSITNAVYFLKRRIPPDQTTWHEYLQIIEDEARGCEKIIDDLLEVTRAREPDCRPCDLRQLVRQAAARLGAPAGVRLDIQVDPDPFVIQVDPVHFPRVVENILKNAFEAVEGDGTVSVRAYGDGPEDVIQIADDGPGIACDQRGRVFEHFFTTKAKGTGLGLPICRQIVQRHHGTLQLLETSVGAAFEIRLPKNAPASSASDG